MCKLLHLFILLGFTCLANAQINGVSIGGKWADQVSISDVNGRPFEKKYDDVNGQPYFNAAYKFANISLANGRLFTHIKTRINLVEQVTVFITANGIEAYIEPGAVKEISYTDTTDTGILPHKFQTGFPAIDRQQSYYFYQVLAEGRCTMLKSIVKSIAEKKNELSGEISRDMETTEGYYLFINGSMNRLKKDKKFLLTVLADKKEKTTVKNTDQLIKLINYYNSL